MAQQWGRTCLCGEGAGSFLPASAASCLQEAPVPRERAARSEGVLGGYRGQGRRFSLARGAGVRVSGGAAHARRAWYFHGGRDQLVSKKQLACSHPTIFATRRQLLCAWRAKTLPLSVRGFGQRPCARAGRAAAARRIRGVGRTAGGLERSVVSQAAMPRPKAGAPLHGGDETRKAKFWPGQNLAAAGSATGTALRERPLRR